MVVRRPHTRTLLPLAHAIVAASFRCGALLRCGVQSSLCVLSLYLQGSSHCQRGASLPTRAILPLKLGTELGQAIAHP